MSQIVMKTQIAREVHGTTPGNKNATTTQMRKAARMSFDTLNKVFEGMRNKPILEAHKSQGASRLALTTVQCG